MGDFANPQSGGQTSTTTTTSGGGTVPASESAVDGSAQDVPTGTPAAGPPDPDALRTAMPWVWDDVLDTGEPGYLEETGFGSLDQVERNRAKYEGRVNEPEEYVPDLGAPERGRKGMSPEEIGRTDLDETFEKNPALRERVSTVADELGLDPGLLAASMFAENSDPSKWASASGTVPSEKLGLDDWWDPAMEKQIKQILKAHPDLGLKYADVSKTGRKWATSTEKAGGGWKDRGNLSKDKAVAAAGVYQKAEEEFLRKAIADEQKGDPSMPSLDALDPDQRPVLLRYTVNAGVGKARQLYRQIAGGGDIPRTGGTQRDRHHPARTAALHVGRAIHLDQTVFGRSPEDDKP